MSIVFKIHSTFPLALPVITDHILLYLQAWSRLLERVCYDNSLLPTYMLGIVGAHSLHEH